MIDGKTIVFNAGFMREQGFSFDMLMWEKLTKYTKVSLDEINQLGDKLMDVIYYCAAYSYDVKHNNIKWRNGREVIPYSEGAIKKFILNLKYREYLALEQSFKQSQIGGETIETIIDKESKKK